MPDGPGLAVVPNEVNPMYPEFIYAAQGTDLWYGYLMLSKDSIQSKYHSIIGYTPLNENVDTEPWLGQMSTGRGSRGNMNRMKLYGNESSIGKDVFTVSDYDVGYATTDGVYSSATSSTMGNQTLEGLSGRALDSRTEGATIFPYRSGYTNLGNTGAGFSYYYPQYTKRW
jgi:hypothetical protein